MATAVLTVNFRGYDDLARCLESLVPQLGPDDEVIVVDNESNEERLKWVLERHPHVIAIPRTDNIGFAAGINLAARHSRAPFLLLLNPDTTVEGPVIAMMEQWLQSHPETAVVGPRVRNPDGSIQASARCFPGLSTVLGGRSTWLTQRYPNNWWSRRNLLGLETTDPIDVDWVSGSCLMTRREAFEHLGGLDEAFFLYWEDADYCSRARLAGSRCIYLPSVAVRHGGGGSARFDMQLAIRAFHRSAFLLYWKYAGLAGRVLAPLVRAGLYLRGEIRLRRARSKAELKGSSRRPLPI